MEDWQGPAIWIYNDAEFSDKDFQSLIKLGVGGKSRNDNENDTRIGKFGIGFNCAYHITDLPSFVSGKYIAFFDPNAKYLDPSRKRKGNRINFIEQEFKKRFPDQCYPYEAIEGCDLEREFRGTLFRLPLRTSRLAEQSEISNRAVEIQEMLRLFSNVQGNKEMLFLRNIESCSLYHMKEQIPQLIWQAQINISDADRIIRQSVTDKPQIYQMDIKIINNELDTKLSEIWLLCTGGIRDIIKTELKDFSNNKRLKVNIIYLMNLIIF